MEQLGNVECSESTLKKDLISLIKNSSLIFLENPQNRDEVWKIGEVIQKIITTPGDAEIPIEELHDISDFIWKVLEEPLIENTQEEIYLQKRFSKFYEEFDISNKEKLEGYAKLRVSIYVETVLPLMRESFKRFNLSTQQAGEVKEVLVTPRVVSLSIAQKKVLRAFALDGSGEKISGRTFEWVSSEPKSVVVDQVTGVVTGRFVGNAEITGTDRETGKAGKAKVRVS